jgi:hypothetical protein
LAWVVGVMSPISSRKSVPPLACSKRPTRTRSAPVNAPRSCPKSSDSSSVSGSAAQLTLTKGPSARGEREWISPAITSFPVPVSPVISTVLREGATRRARSTATRSAWLVPMMPSGGSRRSTRARKAPTSRASRACSTARRTRISSCSRSKGFWTKSNAPSRIASTAVSMVP